MKSPITIQFLTNGAMTITDDDGNMVTLTKAQQHTLRNALTIKLKATK